MIYSFIDSLSVENFILSAVAAFILTLFYNVFNKVFKSIIHRSTEFDYAPHRRDSVLEKCYMLFPTEYLCFNDSVFRRGMQVRIFTSRNKEVKGQFVGVNKDNMICIVTQHQVVAQELNLIEEMEEV